MIIPSTALSTESELAYHQTQPAPEETVCEASDPIKPEPDLVQFLAKLAPIEQWQSITHSTIAKHQVPPTRQHVYLDKLLLKADNPSHLFEQVREGLSPNHYFAFKITTAENIKSLIKSRYSNFLFTAYYPFHFLGHRVLPKLKGFRKVCRLLHIAVDMSKAEVMGRLIFHGFEIVQLMETDQETYFVTKPHPSYRPSVSLSPPSEGFLFTMKRVGKENKPITIYKLRSMHPYAEYAQEYVHKTQGLDTGGKFKNDFRVSTGGRLIRKYWIDELPMLYNLLKGDIKLIGVRPISEHYFNLYPERLRAIRCKHKPGLLPPFYADLPKGLDEIVQSELMYLEAYEKNPLKTDLTYLGKILKNIVVNKARSQ
ncbi:hypothetical protein GCM10027347_53960 [Larkinella harenae]